MTQIHWANAVSGDFNTASDWTGGVVPGRGDNAYLDASGGNYTVSVPNDYYASVSTISIAKNATIEILAGTTESDPGGLVDVDGTGPLNSGGGNYGAIILDVGDNDSFAELQIGGTFNNKGNIKINAGNMIFTSDTTLYGGGVITLAGGQISGGTVTNTDNFISGYGDLGEGYGALTFVNEVRGVIDADGANQSLLLATGDVPLQNAGLIEATGAAGLVIDGTAVDDSSGGSILARGGSKVTLGTADIIGGILKTVGGGVITTSGEGLALLDGRNFAVRNEGHILINDSQVLETEGSIINSGRIVVDSAGDPTILRILPSGVTLSGEGSIELRSRFAEIAGLSPSAVLINVDNQIYGSGRLGDGDLTLLNETAGVIAGTRSTPLIIDTGANTITNDGLIVARAGGNVVIDSPVVNSGTLDVEGGTMTVDTAVTGFGGALIDGGTLDVTKDFVEPLTFGGAGGTLVLNQKSGIFKDITGFSTGGGTVLDLRDIGFVSPDEATFSGDILSITDGTHLLHVRLTGVFSGVTFTAASDGQGGTLVTASADAPRSTKALTMSTTHAIIAAMAGLGAPSGGGAHGAAPSPPRQAMLLAPRAAVA